MARSFQQYDRSQLFGGGSLSRRRPRGSTKPPQTNGISAPGAGMSYLRDNLCPSHEYADADVKLLSEPRPGPFRQPGSAGDEPAATDRVVRHVAARANHLRPTAGG